MIERIDLNGRSYEIELDNHEVTFWRIKPEVGHSITVKDQDSHFAYYNTNKGWHFERNKVESAIRLFERKQLFDTNMPVAEVAQLLSDNARYTDINQIVNGLINDLEVDVSDPQWAGNRVLEKLLNEWRSLGERLGYLP